MKGTVLEEQSEHKRVILHVTECYEGGVSRALRSYVVNSPEYVHWLLAEGSDVTEESTAKRFEKVWTLDGGPVARARQLAELAGPRVSLIHAHSSWAGVYSRLMRMRVPVVYQPHGYAFEMASAAKRVIFFLAERVLGARRIAATVVLSARERTLASRVSPRSPAVDVPNVPTVAHAPRSGKREIDEALAWIGMVGRIAEQKDPDYFIRLIVELQRRGLHVRGLWIGDGTSADRLRMLEHNVVVTGWLEAAALEDELDRCAVYVHTAKYEGFPLSVLDAAARNLAVLARAIPAFEGSPILTYATLEAHADAVAEILEDPRSMALAVERGHALLETMSPLRQQEALRDLYGGLIR